MEIIKGVRVYDIHDTIAALRTVVQGREDFVYTESEDYLQIGDGCVNWVLDGGNWRPSCIVGHVLTAWDYPDECKPHTRFSGPAGTLGVQDEICTTTPKALHILTVAQGRQDNGGTWGEALKRAEEKYAQYV